MSAYGVKFHSVFNQLMYFHVASQASLHVWVMNCLKGLFLLISLCTCMYKHLVKTEKQFTYNHLNRIISQFPYKAVILTTNLVR